MLRGLVGRANVNDRAWVSDRKDRTLDVLNSLSVNLFICDFDLNVVYQTDYAERTLHALDGELRKAFNVSAAEVLGGSIQRFHEDPANVLRILNDEQLLPREATFPLGALMLRTTIDAVRDRDGRDIGFLAVVDDVTEQHRVQTQVTAVAQRLAEASQRLAQLSEQLESVIEMATERASNAAAGTDRLNTTIQEIAATAAAVVASTSETVSSAEAATTRVTKLGDSSAQISEIAGLITAIATQTSLLALNATIESARAGEAGRGFAVVAGEVKELAGRTAASTEQINEMIGVIQADSGEANASIDTIVELIQQIVEQQTSISTSVEEQASTSHSISGEITMVANGIGNAASAAKETRAAAASLADRAAELTALVERTT
jgi:methyl-accepting chemotaxis protein